MKKRHVFSTPNVTTAESVRAEARRLGIGRECICLEARKDIEARRVDDEKKNVSMDIVPAAWHGAIYGAVAGFAAGLVAMFVPFFGLSLAGAGVLAVVGALVGTWASVLVGSALPDEVRRTFAGEIAAGQVLVVIDAEPEQFATMEPALAAAGAVRLPFESTSALTS
jgi:uncharacterized membrane protein